MDDRLAWQRTSSLIILTLLSIVPEVPQTGSRCFELMGFDVLFDDKLKPWLLEINYAPSLTQEVAEDAGVKSSLLVDTMALCNYHKNDGLRGKVAPLPEQPPSRTSRLGPSRRKSSLSTPPTDVSARRGSECESERGESDGDAQGATDSDKPSTETTTPGGASGKGKAKPPTVRMSNSYKLRMSTMAEKKATQERRANAARASRERATRKLPSGTIRRESGPTPAQERRQSQQAPDFATRLSQIPARVGNYQLVFPFNETTLEASCCLRKRYDARKIIGEVRSQQARLAARLKKGQDKGLTKGDAEEIEEGEDVLFLPDHGPGTWM